MIHLENISKTFKVAKRSASTKDVVKSFFHKEYQEVHALSDVSFDIQKRRDRWLHSALTERVSPPPLKSCVVS